MKEIGLNLATQKHWFWIAQIAQVHVYHHGLVARTTVGSSSRRVLGQCY